MQLEIPGASTVAYFDEDGSDPEVQRRNLLTLFRLSGSPTEAWEVCSILAYQAHGGSGYNFNRADVMDMEAAEAIFYMEAIGEFREAEAKAIREAGRKKPPG